MLRFLSCHPPEDAQGRLVLRLLVCMQAQTVYLEAVEKFGKMKDEVEGLLSDRDEAYLELLAVPDAAGKSLLQVITLKG